MILLLLGYTPFFNVLNALVLILCLLARRVQWVVVQWVVVQWVVIHGRFLLVDILYDI